MSDCSQNAFQPVKPIKGRIVWKDGQRPTPLDYARYVNGAERVADHIDFDGERYERVRECENASPYAGEFKCSECGVEWKTEDMDLVEPTLWIDGVADYPSYCQHCGARVKEVE
jgi:hypothetical protein